MQPAHCSVYTQKSVHTPFFTRPTYHPQNPIRQPLVPILLGVVLDLLVLVLPPDTARALKPPLRPSLAERAADACVIRPTAEPGGNACFLIGASGSLLSFAVGGERPRLRPNRTDGGSPARCAAHLSERDGGAPRATAESNRARPALPVAGRTLDGLLVIPAREKGLNIATVASGPVPPGWKVIGID